jgi:hypothetical protein
MDVTQRWILGGIVMSHVADLPSILFPHEGAGGLLPVGRFLLRLVCTGLLGNLGNAGTPVAWRKVLTPSRVVLAILERYYFKIKQGCRLGTPLQATFNQLRERVESNFRLARCEDVESSEIGQLMDWRNGLSGLANYPQSEELRKVR